MARPSLLSKSRLVVGVGDRLAGRVEGLRGLLAQELQRNDADTAMRATRRAYSTREAPRSVSPKRARSQVARNS